jgi:hypothetical protein
MHNSSTIVVVSAFAITTMLNIGPLHAWEEEKPSASPKDGKVLMLAPLSEFMKKNRENTSVKNAKIQKELLGKIFKDNVVVTDVEESLGGVRITSLGADGTLRFQVSDKTLL